jgi:flavin reductase (DIM6/NTAB) family NADH-FMN oxidoreductase RutF
VSSERTTFEALVGDLYYPMYVVTTASGGERAGCLVGFAGQVSIHPPRFMACLSRRNRTFRVGCEAELLVVHFLPEDAADLAELFGGETGDDVDKFERCEWEPGPGGAPVVKRLDHWFAGRILERVDLGDHVGFLLEPIAGEARGAQEQFSFHRAKRIEPGHEP